MSGSVDVMAVMDADGRAVALLSDEYHGAGKAKLAEQWSDHLSVHDEARAAVAEVYAQRDALVETLRYAVDNPDFDSERFDALARATLARVQGGAA